MKAVKLLIFHPILANSKCITDTGPLDVVQVGLTMLASLMFQMTCSSVNRRAPARCPLAECQISFAHLAVAAVAAAAVGSPCSSRVFLRDFPPPKSGNWATAVLCRLSNSILSNPPTVTP